MARAVNMGISAVIDSNGRVQKPKAYQAPGGPKLWVVDGNDTIPELTDGNWRDFTKVEGILIAAMPLATLVLALLGWIGNWYSGHQRVRIGVYR